MSPILNRVNKCQQIYFSSQPIFRVETQNSEMHKFQMPIYSSKLKGLQNKLLNKHKLNGIYRAYMKVSFSWLNSFVGTKSVE